MQKDQCLVRSVHPTCSYTWKRDGAPDLKNTPEIELLGQIITETPGHSPSQVARVAKTISNRAQDIRWLLSVNALPSVEILTRIFDTMATSLATSKLILLNLSSAEIFAVEKPKIQTARAALGVHPYTSRWALYYELGWTSVQSHVLSAKLLFLGRLFRVNEADDPIIYHIVRLRVLQVEGGDRQGFLGTLYGLLLEHEDLFPRALDLWQSDEPLSVFQWKNLVKDFVNHSEHSNWSQWTEKGGHQQKWAILSQLADSMGAPDYTTLPLIERSKFASARLCVTRAASDIPGPGSQCRCCGHPDAETIQHLVCQCPAFAPSRRKLWCPRIIPVSNSLEDTWCTFLTLPTLKVSTFFSEIESTFYGTTGHDLFFNAFSMQALEQPDNVKFQRDVAELNLANSLP